MKKLVLLAVVVFGFTATSIAQTLTASTTATVKSIYTFAKVADLAFGDITPSSVNDGKVVVESSSNFTHIVTGAGIVSTGTAATIHAAKFTISGPVGNTPTVRLSGGSPILLTGPGTDITVNLNSSFNPAGEVITIPVGGISTIYVGGEIMMPHNQAPGSYSNWNGLEVTVSY